MLENRLNKSLKDKRLYLVGLCLTNSLSAVLVNTLY